MPVLTEWENEGGEKKKKRGGKQPTEAFFNMAFCQLLLACQKEKAVCCMLGWLESSQGEAEVREL